MVRFGLAYVAALVALAVIDGVWLGFVAKDFYRNQIGAFMAPHPVVWAAAAFYLLYPAGLVFFAVAPALKEGSVSTALLYGAFFGLVAYGTYDLSNLATLQDWPQALTFVDLVWGAVLSAAVSAASCLAASRFA